MVFYLIVIFYYKKLYVGYFFIIYFVYYLLLFVGYILIINKKMIGKILLLIFI